MADRLATVTGIEARVINRSCLPQAKCLRLIYTAILRSQEERRGFWFLQEEMGKSKIDHVGRHTCRAALWAEFVILYALSCSSKPSMSLSVSISSVICRARPPLQSRSWIDSRSSIWYRRWQDQRWRWMEGWVVRWQNAERVSELFVGCGTAPILSLY